MRLCIVIYYIAFMQVNVHLIQLHFLKGITVKMKNNLINFVFKILKESLIATLCRNVLQNIKTDMKEGCISRCYKLKVAFNNLSPFVKHMIQFIKQYLIQTFLKKFFAHSHEFRKR